MALDLTDRLKARAGGHHPDSPDHTAFMEAVAEIERLRVVIRVNGLRAGATNAEIDAVLQNKE